MKLASPQTGGRRLLQALLDETEEPVLALDENGAVLEANAAAALALGRPRQHLDGKPLAALVPLEHRRELRRAIATVTATEPVRLVMPVGAAGRRWTLVLRALPRESPRTIAVRLLGGRARPAPAQPPDLRMELDRIFRRFPSGVLGISRESLRVAFMNAHARTLLGGLGVAVGAPLPRDGFPDELRALAERVTTLKVPLRGTQVELPDDRIVRVTGVPPLDGGPALLLLEDVTGQERQERVMRDFLRNAAHQLRTPLTALTTAVQVLQSGAKERPAERDRFLEHLEQHVARMTRLTRGLLMLARAQSKQQALRLDFVELGPLLERIAAQAEPRPGVTLETSCPPGLAAFGEPDLAEEALVALVENALEHTREGTVRLAAAEVDGRAVIEVVDSGIGILPEHRERIFEPFYRTAARGDGFGLGLAIAAEAVRAMDGTISVTGVPGGGTTFLVKLPSARVSR